ncbi:MAG: hypothetical protein J6Y70_00805 [Bacilli bacterium]|nr:hypothetical protein [Bacilli bacterium]
MSSCKPYGLSVDFFKDSSKYKLPKISDSEISSGYKIIGFGEKQHIIYKYISNSYLLPKTDNLNKFKVFIPESFGCDIMGEGSTNPVIGKPGTLFAETFLEV